MSALGPLPPHRLFEGFLASAEHRRLLDWTLASRDRFQPSRLVGGVIDPARRVPSNLRDLGEMRAMIEAAVTARLTDLFGATGVAPFAIDAIELELAHHG